MLTHLDLIPPKQTDLGVLETCKQSMEIQLAAKEASLDQWKEDYADLTKQLADKDEELATKEKELAGLLEAVSQQLAAKDEDLAKALCQIQQLKSDVLSNKCRIRKLKLQERHKFQYLHDFDRFRQFLLANRIHPFCFNRGHNWCHEHLLLHDRWMRSQDLQPGDLPLGRLRRRSRRTARW